ncbi:unnamed protein product [Rhizophagus irregularis]|nr:unnamed protein product [Rhizophagus irregularis]
MEGIRVDDYFTLDHDWFSTKLFTISTTSEKKSASVNEFWDSSALLQKRKITTIVERTALLEEHTTNVMASTFKQDLIVREEFTKQERIVRNKFARHLKETDLSYKSQEKARTTKGMPLSPVVREEAPGEATAQPDSSSSNSESGGTGIASVDQTKVEVPPLRAVTPSSQRLSHELQKIRSCIFNCLYATKNVFSPFEVPPKSPSMPNQEDENTKTIPPIIINEDGDIMTDKEVMRDTYLRIRQELCDLSSQKDWIIEGYNVSDAFRKYQITNIDKLVDGEIFQFSSDIEAILSLHFIDLTKTKKSLYLDIEDRKWRASQSNQFRPVFSEKLWTIREGDK